MLTRLPVLLSLLLISACDPSILFGTPSTCTTTALDCPAGCVQDLPDGELTVSGLQCGVAAGDDTTSCWEARTEVVLGDAACAYADAYDDPGTASTCTGLSVEVCVSASAPPAERLVARR